MGKHRAMPRVRVGDKQKTPTVMIRLLLPSQASESAYPKAVLSEKAVPLVRQVIPKARPGTVLRGSSL